LPKDNNTDGCFKWLTVRGKIQRKLPHFHG
jgi:hypothetical protein